MAEKTAGNTKPSPNNKKVNTGPVKKKKKKISGGAVFSIILIIGVVGVIAMVYLNVGGMKQTVASMLSLETPTDQQIAAADEATAAAQAKQEEVDAQEKALGSEQRALAKREEEIIAQEEALIAKEEALDAKEEKIGNTEKSAEQEQKDLEATVLIFEQMEAVKAAEAISGMDSEEDMARVLINMTSERAASIVNEMDAALVTKIFQQ